MIIAIQSGLENLGDALREYGFEVVDIAGSDTAVDALIYMGESMPYVSVTNKAGTSRHGVFMVNARGKSADEIAQILSRRTYTPLF